ncbi:hypothetical protein FRB99_002207 [Tulasnella sp. 403]|nr:hypothetical protein FRB99_002207 [Tulasnella sp. 403]
MGTSESRTRIPMRRSSEASRSPTTPTTVTPITPASTTPANAFGASDKAARRRSAIVPLGGLTPVKDSDKSYSVDAELSRVESEVQETPTKAPVQSSVLSGLQRNRSPSVATQGGESIIRANANPRNEPSITTDISSTPTSSSIISPHTRTTTMTSEAPPSVGSSLIPVHNSRHASRMVEVTDLTSRLQIRKDLTHRSGGFSDVFQGDLSVDGASAQRVAVKVIRPVNMNVKSEDFKSRFERRVRQMVLNKVPFSDFQNGLAVMGAKQRGVSPLPRSFEVSDSDHFWMLMEKCWCLDPGERLPIQAVVSRLIEIGS